MRKADAMRTQGETRVHLRAPRWIVFVPRALAVTAAVTAVAMMRSGSEPAVNVFWALVAALFMAYIARYADEQVFIGSRGVAWRGTWGFGWNALSAGSIASLTLSQGNLLNHPIVLAELHAGETVWVPFPGIAPDERDAAFDAFEDAVRNANTSG